MNWKHHTESLKVLSVLAMSIFKKMSIATNLRYTVLCLRKSRFVNSFGMQ